MPPSELQNSTSQFQTPVEKPPLSPAWAIGFTVMAVIGATIAFVQFHVIWTVPLGEVAAWTAVFGYLIIAFAWSALEWPTRNAAVRGHNAFLFVVIATLIASVGTPQGQPFPRWGTITIIVAAILGYSVMGICGIRNFLRWIQGAYRSLERDDDAELGQENIGEHPRGHPLRS